VVILHKRLFAVVVARPWLLRPLTQPSIPGINTCIQTAWLLSVCWQKPAQQIRNASQCSPLTDN